MRSKIETGHGTIIRRLPPRVEGVKKDDPGLTWLRIEQTIVLSVEVPIYTDTDSRIHAICGICEARPPLPSGRGAEFILENNDGARICFPEAEDTEEERDRYPVTGWKRIEIDGKEILACKECCDKVATTLKSLQATIKAVRKRVQK